MNYFDAGSYMDFFDANSFLIRGARVYDGLAGAAVAADVAVADGRIAAVAAPGSLTAAGHKVVDGSGLALAPGFIDVHAHSDITITLDPDADSRLAQGTTTEVIGNCGSSNWCDALEPELLGESPRRWHSCREYIALLAELRPAVNIVGLCGHNTLRMRVMGFADRPATPAEVAEMKRLLAEALATGAAGFSSGLWYIPGRYSETAEVCEIASALRGTGKIYTTHMRSEGDRLLEAVEEAKTIAAAGDGRLQVSHMKTMGEANWSKLDDLFASLDEGRRRGLRITADRYPYVHCGLAFRMVMPEPFAAIADIAGYIRASADNRAALRDALADHPFVPFDRIVVCNTYAEADRELLGLTLPEFARRRGVSVLDQCMELLENRPDTFAAFQMMSEENLARILAQPYVVAGSDGYALPFDGNLPMTHPHPRDFGTQPRFFRAVSRSSSPGEAIRRMTSLPAELFRIPDRGVIAPGKVADLVLFDEEEFDVAVDFRRPETPARGVKRVWIAGHGAYDGREPQTRGRRYGAFLPIPNLN